MKQHIAIVGAGLSGLMTARTLLAYGHRVTVFEKENTLGGVWNPVRRYPGLTTQNTRDSYAFSEFPMPKHYPEFPTGAQMFDYLSEFAGQSGLTPYLRTGHRIDSATPEHTAGKTRWRVQGSHDGQPFEEFFDFLVVCNGTFSEPFVPPAPGRSEFESRGGRVLHTTGAGDPDVFRAKKVVVVGYGKSACDVASAVADVAASTQLVYREAKWKVPKRILGVNYKYLLLTRFGEALTKLRYRNRVENAIHALGLPPLLFGRFEAIFKRQQSLKKAGLVPEAGIADQLYGELSVESDGFFPKVIEGRIRTHRSEIARFFPGGVELNNGALIEADVVIYGTGFRQEQHFLPESVRAQYTDVDGNFRLYRNILPVQTPGLAFVGYNTSFYCNLTSEFAALWLAEWLEGRIRLPSPEVMAARTAELLEWRLRFRPNGLFSNAGVYPFHLTYVDWLLADMGERLPLSKLLQEWLVVMDPSHYAGVKRRIMGRNASREKAFSLPLPSTADL